MPYKVHFPYCFVCTTIFSVHLWIYSVSNGKLASKWMILYFLSSFCPNFGPFCSFKRSSDRLMLCKVHFRYFFVCTTICSVHLWIYSVPNGKLASKLTILYFWPSFCPSSCDISMHWNVHFWYCFVCPTTFSIHLWSYSVPNGKLVLKLAIFYFDPPLCLVLVPFCTVKRSSNLNIAYKICGCHCSVYPPTQTIYLWSYST